jgi:hypothetical protein
MENILKFEGAGWADCDTSKATDLLNCRIRTAFSVEEKVYYLECLISEERKNKGQYELWVDAFLDITEAKSLYCDYDRLPEERKTQLSANKAELLNFINSTTGADFTDIETVNDNSFRVFPDAPEGIDHRRVFRLGNTGEVYVAPQVLTAYEQFKHNARADENARLFEFNFCSPVDMTVDFCRKLLLRKGYKFTRTGKKETGEPEAIFNDDFMWGGAVQEENRIAIRLDRLTVNTLGVR